MAAEKASIAAAKFRVIVMFSGSGSVEKAIMSMYPGAEIESMDIKCLEHVNQCMDAKMWMRNRCPTISPGSIDLLWASPPCDQYSVANTSARSQPGRQVSKVCTIGHINNQTQALGNGESQRTTEDTTIHAALTEIPSHHVVLPIRHSISQTYLHLDQCEDSAAHLQQDPRRITTQVVQFQGEIRQTCKDRTERTIKEWDPRQWRHRSFAESATEVGDSYTETNGAGKWSLQISAPS
jgi:hypothetical protein